MSGMHFGPPKGGWPDFKSKSQPKCYLAGPIRGVENYQAAFRTAKAELEALGWAVWSPLDCIEKTGQVPGQDLDDRQGMADDIAALVQCDCIMVLPGWFDSRGAQAEVAVANSLDIPVHQYEFYGYWLTTEEAVSV
ncbi:MAG: DUF4406 domain-containing protein [Candidatus Dormibacteria bacterium]